MRISPVPTSILGRTGYIPPPQSLCPILCPRPPSTKLGCNLYLQVTATYLTPAAAYCSNHSLFRCSGSPPLVGLVSRLPFNSSLLLRSFFGPGIEAKGDASARGKADLTFGGRLMLKKENSPDQKITRGGGVVRTKRSRRAVRPNSPANSVPNDVRMRQRIGAARSLQLSLTLTLFGHLTKASIEPSTTNCSFHRTNAACAWWPRCMHF